MLTGLGHGWTGRGPRGFPVGLEAGGKGQFLGDLGKAVERSKFESLNFRGKVRWANMPADSGRKLVSGNDENDFEEYGDFIEITSL